MPTITAAMSTLSLHCRKHVPLSAMRAGVPKLPFAYRRERPPFARLVLTAHSQGLPHVQKILRWALENRFALKHGGPCYTETLSCIPWST